MVAEAANPDMYRAIDLAVDKIESQLKKHKGKIHSRIVRRKRPETTEMEGPESGQEA
jgi:putative sigma-54 modulation protein